MRTRWAAATALTCGTVMIATAMTTAATAAPAPNSAILLVDGGRSTVVANLTTGALTTAKPITGFKGADTKLVGIDARVQDGLVYGVGDAGGLYKVSSGGGNIFKVRDLTVALSGTAFGVDFNPAANALRIVSDTGQNLRQPFADSTAATIVDGALNYVAGTTATGIAAAAYTNNDLSADSGTTLFDIDVTLDQVVTQAPANAGSLQATGKLGADVSRIGFDIGSTVDGTGRTTDNVGYAVVPGAGTTDGTTTLHTVSLLTGQAPVTRTFTGTFVDIALRLAPPVA